MWRNKDIIVLKQGKGQKVVILCKNKYTNRCLSMLATSQFMKLNKNSTNLCESKIEQNKTTKQKHEQKAIIPRMTIHHVRNLKTKRNMRIKVSANVHWF